MQTALRRMGNSIGMIVPKSLLSELGIAAGTPMDVRLENGALIARPVRSPREGWAEDAERIGSLPLTQEEEDWMGFGNEGDDELTW